MKRVLTSLFAISLLTALPALAAQDEGREQQRGGERGGEGPRNEGPRNEGGQQGAPNRGPQGNERPGQPQGGPRTGAPQPAQAAPDRGGRGNANNNNNGPNNRGQAQAAPDRGGRGNAGRPVEHGPSQFERRAFQRNVTAPRRFRAGAFRSPPGWQYRRWAYGESLPRAFWAQPYWIANFALYDLDRPPLGCEWVRSGPDALLVDTSTGEILEAEYNVFY